MLVAARFANIEMAAKPGRAALPNVCQHTPLLRAEANFALKSIAVLSNDIG
jgi:hypothetical protein